MDIRENGENGDKIFFWGEDVTIQATLPPSLVTFCHQIWLPPLPLPSGDVLFEWPLSGFSLLDKIYALL